MTVAKVLVVEQPVVEQAWAVKLKVELEWKLMEAPLFDLAPLFAKAQAPLFEQIVELAGTALSSHGLEAAAAPVSPPFAGHLFCA